MHTFRFNPLFKHWVVLGTPMGHQLELNPGHLLHSGGKSHFLAATNPEQPFVLDSPGRKPTGTTLYEEQPPLGEYELLLYRGDAKVSHWRAIEWEQWLELIQQRLRHFQHNPNLHHVEVRFHTSWVNTVGPAMLRVGDVIATSHPVAGRAPLLEHDLIAKLRKRERSYVLHDADDGFIYVPSAPLFEKEVWYAPIEQDSSIADCSAAGRRHTAEGLSLLMGALMKEWPNEHFAVELHTALIGTDNEVSWWVRVYQEARRLPATLTVLPLPEKFLRELGSLIG
jgi:hypothetical protein